jgi:hypothetical protein
MARSNLDRHVLITRVWGFARSKGAMKYRRKFLRFGILIELAQSVATAQVQPHDTNLPDVFYFTQREYVVAEDAGEAIVRIHWISGGRDMYGRINYETVDQSALAGSDYKSVRGTVEFFDYTNNIPVRIPIIMDEENETDETVFLKLTSAGYYSEPRGNAVLRITNVRVGPRLKVAWSADDTVNIFWPDDGINRVLEKSTTPSSAVWTVVATPASSVGGVFSVNDVRSGPAGFYRLRKLD